MKLFFLKGKMKRKKRNNKMMLRTKIKIIVGILAAMGIAASTWCVMIQPKYFEEPNRSISAHASGDYIKWVDFNVPDTVLAKTMELDIGSYNAEIHLDWIEMICYLACKYGGDFSHYKEKDLNTLTEELILGEKMEALVEKVSNKKTYDYYIEAYSSILGEFLGEYKKETEEGWVTAYGLKAFSPIADGFWYNDYDDFGNSRTYGYKRKHLGHDMMVDTGTPVIAIEGGTIEAIGWNQYGGWRIGIRSFDEKRYYYYAHLRKDWPYHESLYEGKSIQAGDVIGYSGRTGYSTTENVNNIKTPHLHVGMQLIFHPDQKDGDNQIWINMYNICNLLKNNKSEVYKDESTKEYYRENTYTEPDFYLRDSIPTAATYDEETPEGIPVPIIMYHSILKDPNMQNNFVVTPDLLEQDLVYLKENGFTTILMKDLIAYVNGEGTLPDKPIILTFDDGHYNNYYYLFPLLKKYNQRAVISLIGKQTEEFSNDNVENATFGYLTWDKAKEMQQSGYVEMQNHTYDMHSEETRSGVKKLESESDEEYEKSISEDIEKLQQLIFKHTGYLPTTFTYPFGAITIESEGIMKKLGFQATLLAYEGINYVTENPNCLYKMRRNLRRPEIATSDFFQDITDQIHK